MTNQEILAKAPVGAWCVDKTDSYFDSFGNKLNKGGDWDLSDENPIEARCIKDIERIVELERDMAQTMMCIEECTERLRNNAKELDK